MDDHSTVGTRFDPGVPSDDGPVLPPARPTSLRPAALVGAIAVVILVVFAVGAAISGNGIRATSPPIKEGVVKGTSLRAISATAALRHIEQGGEPPVNVVDSIAVPDGYRYLSMTDNTASAGQYDEQVQLSAATSEEALFVFYKAELPKDGWHVVSTGAADGQPGVEVIGEKGGDDGWYWEFGAVISPTTFANPSSGATASNDDVTKFVIRLFQVPDDD